MMDAGCGRIPYRSFREVNISRNCFGELMTSKAKDGRNITHSFIRLRTKANADDFMEAFEPKKNVKLPVLDCKGCEPMTIFGYRSTRIMLTRACDTVRFQSDPWGSKVGANVYMGPYQIIPLEQGGRTDV